MINYSIDQRIIYCRGVPLLPFYSHFLPSSLCAHLHQSAIDSIGGAGSAGGGRLQYFPFPYREVIAKQLVLSN